MEYKVGEKYIITKDTSLLRKISLPDYFAGTTITASGIETTRIYFKGEDDSTWYVNKSMVRPVVISNWKERFAND